MLILTSETAQTACGKTSAKKILSREFVAEVFESQFGNPGILQDIPLPWGSIGIINLGRICKVIYGAQSFAGKILETKELRALPGHLFLLLAPWRSSAF